MSSAEAHLSPKEMTQTQLPTELLFSICELVESRRDLVALSAASRALQRPSECILHRKVVLDSRKQGRIFFSLLLRCWRIVPLVRELRLERCSELASSGIKEYWSTFQGTLSSLTALEVLIVDDGRDAPLSWTLSAITNDQLKVLHCGFILDNEFMDFLQRQSALIDFSWNGSLSLLKSPKFPGSGDISPPELSIFSTDPDHSLMSTLQQVPPPPALPNLKYSHSESLALARSLVPGRPVMHLWVPGASTSRTVAPNYIHRHVTSEFLSHSATSARSNSEDILIFHPVYLTRTDSSNAKRFDIFRQALDDFGLSKGPVLSFRTTMDFDGAESLSVSSYIAEKLPQLRALGYLPSGILDLPIEGCGSPKLEHSEKMREVSAAELGRAQLDPKLQQYILPPFPSFAHLHTISLWSIPSRRAVAALENSPNLPALRTVACLHFSPALEWRYLPVNEDHPDSRANYRGGIKWKHELPFHGLHADGYIGQRRMRRRLTPVHDPDALLWRNV